MLPSEHDNEICQLPSYFSDFCIFNSNLTSTWVENFLLSLCFPSSWHQRMRKTDLILILPSLSPWPDLTTTTWRRDQRKLFRGQWHHLHLDVVALISNRVIMKKTIPSCKVVKAPQMMNIREYGWHQQLIERVRCLVIHCRCTITKIYAFSLRKDISNIFKMW
jgi:hypothetical protein